MNAGQFQTLTALLEAHADRTHRVLLDIRNHLTAPRDIPADTPTLAEILGRVPSGPAPAAPKHPRRRGSDLAAAKRHALSTVLLVLDGWIAGARENHDALGHPTEVKGEECWRQFSPEDFRRMVNDAARELGLSEFPYPSVPKEDQ